MVSLVLGQSYTNNLHDREYKVDSENFLLKASLKLPSWIWDPQGQQQQKFQMSIGSIEAMVGLLFPLVQVSNLSDVGLVSIF